MLEVIRNKMESDALILTAFDPHQSEYAAERWNLREWSSGFTGSAGTVAITNDHAGLWTDGRYYLQAEKELKEGFTLHKAGEEPGLIEWLKTNLPPNSTVTADPMTTSHKQWKEWQDQLKQKMISLEEADLYNDFYPDRPAVPAEEVFILEKKIAGQSAGKKIKSIREEMEKEDLNGYLINGLDEIAWTLNLRGSDVPFNPVFYAYLLIDSDQVILFTQKNRLDEEVKKYLSKNDVQLREYDEIDKELAHYNGLLGYDPALLSHHLSEKISKGKGINSYVKELKAIKNATEIENLRKVMIKDGRALIRTMLWLEKCLAHEERVTEYEVVQKIAENRNSEDGYISESFSTIIGYRENGAVIHYRPEENTSAEIKEEGLLLMDSGGQYRNGTTDTTRTFALGVPSRDEVRNYTLVLKGHIQLARTIFPSGTTGIQLDALARYHLWQHQLNFRHGTGHGVGYFLNVHEPPQGFFDKLNERGKTVFEPGMFTSNEPGYYKNGEYGIRLENLILCVKGGKNEYGQWLGFETITLFPFETALIDPELLIKEEAEWLKSYHRMVGEKLGPYLNDEEMEWLKRKLEINF